MRFAGFRFQPTLMPSLVFLMLLPALLGLGVWQLQRAGEKETLLTDQAARAELPPLDLGSVSGVSVADRFRPAIVEGRFDPSQQWLLDNRVHHGRPGYHVFAAFDIDGSARRVLINRGWIGIGDDRQFLPDLPLPTGRLTLRGRLDTPASVGIVLGAPPVDSIAEKVVLPSLDIAALAEATGQPLLSLALVLDRDQPTALEYDWIQRNEITPEKHLGYAVQWFALAVALTVIYFGVNTQRDRGGRGDD